MALSLEKMTQVSRDYHMEEIGYVPPAPLLIKSISYGSTVPSIENEAQANIVGKVDLL